MERTLSLLSHALLQIVNPLLLSFDIEKCSKYTFVFHFLSLTLSLSLSLSSFPFCSTASITSTSKTNWSNTKAQKYVAL